MDTNALINLINQAIAAQKPVAGGLDYTGISILFGAVAAFIMQVIIYIRSGRLDSGQTQIAAKVEKIEVNSNSMKDALVKATREQSLLEGADMERKDEGLRKAAVGASKEESK